ncbi:hypothetical protein [Ferrimonas pelagia]|uniref:Uncharacterized protein n=1 Tax=Ferrimonas pelagia TaxID=1177826 RepID=A0ABP9EYS3_9GAMM
MNEQWLGQLIEGAYDAAVDGLWYEWLDWLRRSLGASGGVLAHLGTAGLPVKSLPIACGSDLCSNLVGTYVERRSQDPWYRQARRQRNNVVLLDARTRRARARGELSGVFEGWKCHYHTGAVLSSEQGHYLLSLHREPGQSDFNAEQIRMLDQINQHLRQALALTPFLYERVEQRLHRCRLDEREQPQAVVRENGVPAFVNDAMAAYLRGQGHAFRFHHGRLCGRKPLLDRLLQQAQQQACQGQTGVCRLPLEHGALSVSPLPEEVLPRAALWQIQHA